MKAARKRPEPPSAATPSPGIWERRVHPFLDRHSRALAVCLVAISTLRIVATYSVFGNTGDEPAHLACGVEYWAKHVYRYESQHPPLARAMVALGPFLAGARPQGKTGFVQEGMAIINYQHHPELTLDLMRIGVLPFFFLACLVVWYWTARAFGRAAAALATALFTLLPPVLAHAAIGCTDMALAACLGAAFLTLILWAEQPTPRRALLFGLATALACLSKFTAMGFLPAAALLALLAYLATVRPTLARLTELARERAATFGLAVATGALVIWAAYWFSFGRVPAWGIVLPAPEFFDGIHSSMQHNRLGHPAYLLGQVSSRGWWYYFPVVLAVKTPIAFLLLCAFGVYLAWRNRVKLEYLLPLAFAIGILIPAMTSNVNIGVRHILPIYIGLSLVAAAALVEIAGRAPRWAGMAAALLVVWLAATGAIHHPDYLAYFNEFVSEPDTVLVDSDYDWGQDTKRLAKRLRELGATSVSFGGIGASDDEFLQIFPGLPPVQHIHPLNPLEGYTAVSPTLWRATQYGLYYKHPNVRPWFEQFQPQERVGSLLLYYIPPGSLRRVR